MPVYCIYAIFNDKSFNDMLTYDIISFEQLGPGMLFVSKFAKILVRSSHEVCFSVTAQGRG